MCGIVGIFDRKGHPSIDDRLLEAMASCLTHRGPDDDGYYLENNIGFGFRRLSIIDLNGGRQPMFNEDGSVILICNGEIYNYKELRDNLRKKGHRFSSECDVEVILHLYEEEGTGFIRRLNGQFAFALFDKRKDRLLIARDQAGIAPLFYTEVNDQFIFASEIKAILKHPGVKREVNLTCLDQIMSFPGYVSPATMFRDIHSVKPGHFILVDRHQVTVEEYWDLDFANSADRAGAHSEEYYVDRLEEVLLQAVKYRLNADVPVGFYLSGGLDSSLIGAMIHKIKGADRNSFSIIYGEDGICERKFQRQMCAHLQQKEHHEIMFTPENIAERLRTAIYFSECPIKESYNTSSLALSEEVRRQNIKVVLTGEGSDELFAGYVGHRFDQMRSLYPEFSDERTSMDKELSEKMWGDNNFLYEKNYDAFRKTKKTIYSDGLNDVFDQFDCFTDGLVNKSKLEKFDTLQKRSYLDFKLRLADHLVSDHGDRVSYANSVEARYPFLDINVIEFSAALPSHLKLSDLTEKYIVRRCAERYLPKTIINREKFGWVAPGSHYLLKRNIEWINDLLSFENIKKQGYFNPEMVETMKETHLHDGFHLNQVFETDFLMIILTFGLFQEIFDVPSFS